MNERIKDLYIQTLCEYEDANGVFIPPDFVEKFAELIIQECCDAVRYVEALEIKNHFGVE